VSKNSWKVNPTKIEEWNMAPVIADGRLEESVQTVDFLSGNNFGEGQPNEVAGRNREVPKACSSNLFLCNGVQRLFFLHCPFAFSF